MRSWLRGVMFYLLSVAFGLTGLLLINRGDQGANRHSAVGLALAAGLVVFELALIWFFFVLRRWPERVSSRYLAGIIAANVTAALGAIGVVVIDNIIGLRTGDALMGAAGFVLFMVGAALMAFLHREGGE